MIYQAEIDGETWTFYRARTDLPYAEVMAQCGEFIDGRRPDAWINTQYAKIVTDAGEIESEALVREARVFQTQRSMAEHTIPVVQASAKSLPTGDPATTWQGQASMDDADSIF